MQKAIVASLSLLSLATSSLACSVVNGVKFTAYGWPDASGVPAYKCNGNSVATTTSSDRTILGDGSASRPYAAAANGNSIFKKCELVYIPLLEKYFRVQDDCSGCVSAQLDLYIAQYNSDVGQSNCEGQFGIFNTGGKPSHEVIRSPGSFTLNTQPLFTPNPPKCYNNPSDGRVFPSRDGTINCPASANGAERVGATSDSQKNDISNPSPLDQDPAARHRKQQTSPSPLAARKFEA